jgi:hypothetical protein
MKPQSKATGSAWLASDRVARDRDDEHRDAMNVAVATIERGERRAMPQMP